MACKTKHTEKHHLVGLLLQQIRNTKSFECKDKKGIRPPEKSYDPVRILTKHIKRKEKTGMDIEYANGKKNFTFFLPCEKRTQVTSLTIQIKQIIKYKR